MASMPPSFAEVNEEEDQTLPGLLLPTFSAEPVGDSSLKSVKFGSLFDRSIYLLLFVLLSICPSYLEAASYCRADLCRPKCT